MDMERARYLMIEQQIRPWELADQDVLDLLAVVKRENFVPAAYRSMAFVDMEIPLPGSTPAAMLAPKIEAKFMQAVQVKKHEHALLIGAGSGYLAALLGHRARHVVALESDAERAVLAQTNLAQQNVQNVEVVHSNGLQGATQHAPYDVICATGSVSSVPQAWLDQLKIGGRLLAVVGVAPTMQVQLIERQSADTLSSTVLFDTYLPALAGQSTAPAFTL